MSKEVFCSTCVHAITGAWPWSTWRCAVNRMSWLTEANPNECYPCAAINTDGRCPDHQPVKGQLRLKIPKV